MFSLNFTGRLLPHLMLKKKSLSNNMNFISDLNHYNLAHWLSFNGELRAPLSDFFLCSIFKICFYIWILQLEYLVLKIIVEWLMFQEGTNL